MAAASGYDTPPGWYLQDDTSQVQRFWTGERWSNSWKLADGTRTEVAPEGVATASAPAPLLTQRVPNPGASKALPSRPASRAPGVTSSRAYTGRLSKAHAQALVGRDLDLPLGAAYDVKATPAGLQFRGVAPQCGSSTVGWHDIRAMEVQDASRFTATRVVTLGLAGGLAMKKQGSLLALGTRSMGSLAIKFDGVSMSELSVEVQAWRDLADRATKVTESKAESRPDPPPSAPTPTVRERLATLEKLRGDDLLSDEEYQTQRQRILDDL